MTWWNSCLLLGQRTYFVKAQRVHISRSILAKDAKLGWVFYLLKQFNRHFLLLCRYDFDARILSDVLFIVKLRIDCSLTFIQGRFAEESDFLLWLVFMLR